ncbi:MAG: DUF454 domain-containing protein [Aquificae bacterium]|nr:DUF454 domain-containing protein [Aquificota bacterium]
MRKIFYGLCAVFFFLLGLIGLVLPLVPTTPFLILFLLCLHRTNPALVRRLVRKPLFQKYVPRRILSKLT